MIDIDKVPKRQLTKLFDEDIVDYASYDNIRSIPSYVDGLKNSGRKIIWYLINNPKPERASMLAPAVASKMVYLHNPDSLVDTAVYLSSDYSCSGLNLPLIKPLSSSMSKSNRRASDARYSSLKKSDISDLLFNRKDEAVLIHQEFENLPIEPLHLIPTIPISMVNTSNGMGFGFANYFLSRNINEVINECKYYAKNKKFSVNELKPYFNGFLGKIEQIPLPDKDKDARGKKKWRIEGIFNKINQNTIKVTELPVWYDRETYLTHLQGLKDKKVIVSFTDTTIGDKYNIEIKVVGKFWEENKNKDIHKILMLTTDETENMTFIDENNTIVVFQDEMELMQRFCNLKLQFTEKRKTYQLNKFKQDIENLTFKRNFVELVVSEQVKINKQSKAEIVQQLTSLDSVLKTGNNKEEREVHISMPIYNLTKEKILELDKLVKTKQDEFQKLEKTTPEQIWLKELEELEKAL